MRFLLRYAIFAVVGGLVLGLLLRAAGGRRRFGSLCLLGLLPIVGHAIYLAYVLAGAGAKLTAAWPFALLVVLVLAAAAVLIRMWHRSRMLWAAAAPAAATVAYAGVASLMLVFTVAPADVVPSAFAAAVLGLFTLLFLVMLLVFVPGEPRVELPY